MSDARTTNRSAVDLAALARVAGRDLAANGSEALMATRRDLRHRAHDERQRIFDLRRTRRVNHEKYIRKMRKIAHREAMIGLVVGLPLLLFLAIELPAMLGMSADQPVLTSADWFQWLGIVLCGLYAVLMATGGIAFMRGRNWGRRVAQAGLIMGMVVCLVYALAFPVIALRDQHGGGADAWTAVLVTWVIYVGVAAWHGFEARRLRSIQCRAWCSLRINRRIGHSGGELRAMNP